MEDKFMESVQQMVARAIEAQADKEIEVQKKRFEEEMEQYKGELVGRMVNSFRLMRRSPKWETLRTPIGEPLMVAVNTDARQRSPSCTTVTLSARPSEKLMPATAGITTPLHPLL